MNLDDTIKAIAHPLRRNILGWLKEPEKYFAEQEHPLDFGVCAGRIDARTGVSQSTVSAHLAVLQRAGLISSRRLGQWIFYKRNEEAIERFLAQLHQDL
jgi:DNA-binding transcriptional ArsR family regulator